MATVGQIKNQVEFYLQETSFAQDGQDILLDELNQARLDAELLHDWKHSLVEVTLSVDPDTGGSFSSVSGLPSGRRFKAPEAFYLVDSAGDVPLFHTSKKAMGMVKKERLRQDFWDYDTRFRSDSNDGIYTSTHPLVYIVGETVFLDPKPSVAKTLRIDAYTFLADYDNDADTDWFTQNVPQFLKWAAVVALNHKTGTFAPRQEGVLPPPEKARDQAYQRAVSLDNYFYNTGRMPLI